MALSLSLLGGFALDSGGAALPLPPRKARALLAALAVARHRALPRARLAQLLWERSDPEQARASLRQALVQLRRAGVELAVEDFETVALPPDAALDVADFMEAVARGATAEAARLYRGDFMEGQAFRDPAIEEWLRAERTRLRGLAVGALQAELDRLGGRGEAEAVAQRLLSLDPLREAAHRCLMKIDAARGAPAAALARFSALRDLLRRELDAAPEAETTELFHAIRARRSRAAAPPGFAEAAPREPTADLYLRQIVVLAALETGDGDAGSDWLDLVAERVEAEGGAVERREPGQLIAVWGLERTSGEAASVAAALARFVAGQTGDVASFGLLEAAVLFGTNPIELGRAAHRALRLAASAGPGELAIEPRLRRLLEEVTPGQAARPVAPFVGRETEIAQVLGATRAALAVGTGLVVHVAGEAGIGKTRLVREATTRLADEGVPSAAIGFDAFGGETLHLGERIAAALPRSAALEVADATDRAVLAVLLGRPPSIDETLRLSALVPDERRRRDLAMTKRLLADAASGSGLVLVAEDCHWAPHAAGAFLLDLAEMAAEAPVVFLLTERPREDPLAPRLAARGRAPLARLTLAPLALHAAVALARSTSAPEDRAARALARAGGHPLFLLRLLESDWSDDALPPTVASLVQEQIERLPAEERTGLRRASILGRRLDPEAFVGIFGAAPPAPTGDLLIRDGGALVFGHDLIHRAIYESVPEEARLDLHGRAAAHFRHRDPLAWADHALLSNDAADACRAAAAAASEMIATRRFRAATPYIDAALARDADPEAIAEILSCRAGIRRIRGDLNGALEDYRAAYGRAVAQTTQVAMLVRVALMLHRLERGAEADRALDDAEAIADRAGLGGVARAEIHEQRGNRAFVAGDHAACARHHAAALACAEQAGDLRQIARAHGGLGDAAYAAGRMRTAHEHFSRAVALAEQNGFGVVMEEFGFMRAYSLHFSEPGPRARGLADVAVERAMASGAARTEMISRQIRAEIRLSALDLAAAAEDVDRVADLLAAEPEPRFADDLASTRALLLYRSGDHAGAEAIARASFAGAAHKRHAGGLQLGVAALVCRDAETRRSAVRLGSALVKKASLSHGILWFHRLVLESALLHEDVDLARSQIAALRAYTRDEPLGWVELTIENGVLALAPDRERLADHRAHAEAAGIRDLPALG